MCSYSLSSMVRGYYVHKDIWSAEKGEVLRCVRETNNHYDPYAFSFGVNMRYEPLCLGRLDLGPLVDDSSFFFQAFLLLWCPPLRKYCNSTMFLPRSRVSCINAWESGRNRLKIKFRPHFN